MKGITGKAAYPYASTISGGCVLLAVFFRPMILHFVRSIG
jgi:hypothetical protein